jgi:hypothetical protein
MENFDTLQEKYKRLYDASLSLYEAGLWECKDVFCGNARTMWSNLRNALDLDPGYATKKGVGLKSKNNE